MTVLDLSQVRSEAEAIVHRKLMEEPLSVEDITALLSENNIPFSRRVAKEIAWKMAEEGKARFNDKWLLELQG
jgi:hypothetical protein